jgi:succinate dehydrogenase / fumarate reductase cytochrome b subunit
MKGFLKSSIGKKLFMSITGLFLITFLLVHLTVNTFLFFGHDAFISACEFMESPVIGIIEPVLALGFLIHIIYSVMLSIQNLKARGNDRYAKVDQSNSSTWASRNMLVLGIFVASFLILHLTDFFFPISANEELDAYVLVTGRFKLWYISIPYIIGIIALGIHLHHAFWSAFQTIGLSNDIWRKRLTVLGDIFAIIISVGFSIIALYFFMF